MHPFSTIRHYFVAFAAVLLFNGMGAVFTSAVAQNIPDANFAQAIREACPSCINSDDNLLGPAKSLTQLNVSSKGISDLTGIVGFTDLEKFIMLPKNWTGRIT